MIKDQLTPFISQRFINDADYRNGHLRVINALPRREVLGLHIPDMKDIAKRISDKGCEIIKPGEKRHLCNSGTDVIQHFENEQEENLSYEETLIWGFLINRESTPLDERLKRLEKYIPVLDNWAVCDSFCSDAKWMREADKERLWQFIQAWFKSNREFEVRFAIVASMCYFINEEWIEKVFQEIDKIRFEQIKSEYKTVKGKPQTAQEGTVQGTEPYYVRMGTAWLLTTALAQHPEKTRDFIKRSHLPDDVVRLYVRKARESFRTRNVNALKR